MVHNLGKKHSVINHFVAELRNIHVQKDRMRFRNNLRRISACIGYEISKMLDYEPTDVETPLGIASMPLGTDRIVVANVLRAGIPMHEGMLDVFDQADNAFIGAFRKHHKDGSFDIRNDYAAVPSLQDAILILCDPMVATGASIHTALTELKRQGEPKQIHVVCTIASSFALEFLARQYPNVHIWAAAVDEELTAKGYIVPGLGDAGDLAYGSKDSGEVEE